MGFSNLPFWSICVEFWYYAAFALGGDCWSGDWLKATLGQDGAQYLGFANYVVGDYLQALLVWMNFAGMRNLLARSGRWLIAIERPVRRAVGCTFTLYLLHMPLFLMWSAVVRGNPAQPWYWLTVTGLVLASVVLISGQTEALRYRLRGLFTRRGVAMA